MIARRTRLAIVGAACQAAALASSCTKAPAAKPDQPCPVFGVARRVDGLALTPDSGLQRLGRGRIVLQARDGEHQAVILHDLQVAVWRVSPRDSAGIRIFSSGSAALIVLDSLAPGHLTVRLRGIGYISRFDTVAVRAGFEDSVNVTIPRSALCLAPMTTGGAGAAP